MVRALTWISLGFELEVLIPVWGRGWPTDPI